MKLMQHKTWSIIQQVELNFQRLKKWITGKDQFHVVAVKYTRPFSIVK